MSNTNDYLVPTKDDDELVDDYMKKIYYYSTLNDRHLTQELELLPFFHLMNKYYFMTYADYYEIFYGADAYLLFHEYGRNYLKLGRAKDFEAFQSVAAIGRDGFVYAAKERPILIFKTGFINGLAYTLYKLSCMISPI